MKTKLTYAFDAYCGWCYGFAPALHGFTAQNAYRIELEVLSGGLFSGNKAGPISFYPHIPAANERIAKLTGAIFGPGYNDALRRGEAHMDSTDAATGLLALARQEPGRELQAAAVMQSAWYVEGRSLSDAGVYADIAERLGLDPVAVVDAYRNPAVRTEAENQFLALRNLGVQAYPTLIAHTPAGLHRLGGPTSSAQALTEALDRLVAMDKTAP